MGTSTIVLGRALCTSQVEFVLTMERGSCLLLVFPPFSGPFFGAPPKIQTRTYSVWPLLASSKSALPQFLLKFVRARAQVPYSKSTLQQSTMTPTRPTMTRSGFSRPPHGPNPPTNHRIAAPTSMATRWCGGACQGAHRAVNLFVLFKTRKPIHLNWSAFSGSEVEPVL